ncbi:V-type ATP synthase subunit F [Vagococcus acidifermentans]|nr:V-type ATP synthase subunit F [Vagococcus acidifermentans]
MNKQVGVIGDKYSVMPFKMFGFQVYYATSAGQIRKRLNQMAAEDYGVIFMTEAAAELAAETVASYQDKLTPAIILIPDQFGSKGVGMKNIDGYVEKAIGQAIL